MNIHAGALFQFQRIYLKLSPKLSFFCLWQPCLFPFSTMQASCKILPFPWKIPCVSHWNACGWEDLCLPLKLCCDSLQSHTFHTFQVPHLKTMAGLQTHSFGMLPCLVDCLKWGAFWGAAGLFDVATAFLCNLPCHDQIYPWTDPHFYSYPSSEYHFHTSCFIHTVYPVWIKLLKESHDFRNISYSNSWGLRREQKQNYNVSFFWLFLIVIFKLRLIWCGDLFLWKEFSPEKLAIVSETWFDD